MVPGQELRITQPAALDQVSRLPTSSSVVLELPSLQPHEAKSWQRELNASLQTCGCAEATVAFLIGAGALVIAAYTFWNTVKDAPFFSIVMALGCCALSIATGKAIGKWRGRRRLTTSIRRLHAVLMQRAFDRA